MEERIYNVIKEINTQGIGNEQWGLCADIDSTVDYFGTIRDEPINGKSIYIYCTDADDAWRYMSLSKEHSKLFSLRDSSETLVVISV